MPIARRNRCRATDVWSCAVITGARVVSPLGIGSQAHWNALISGHSAVARVDRLPQLGFPGDVGAEVSGQAVAACLPRLPKKQVTLYHHRVEWCPRDTPTGSGDTDRFVAAWPTQRGQMSASASSSRLPSGSRK